MTEAELAVFMTGITEEIGRQLKSVEPADNLEKLGGLIAYTDSLRIIGEAVIKWDSDDDPADDPDVQKIRELIAGLRTLAEALRP